jgi:hypothetical protein
MAINPGEEAKMQMFIWNNIFFSLGFDVKDHYKDLGGDAAAFVAPRNDLQGVKVTNHRLINKVMDCPLEILLDAGDRIVIRYQASQHRQL